MTKFFKLTIAALCAFAAAMVLQACSNDNDDHQINASQLPEKALNTLKQVFPDDKIVRVDLDNSSPRKYEVYLQSGAEAEFLINGEWTELLAAIGKVLPRGIAPTTIEDYIATNYPQYGIHEISRDTRGYELELSNGLDLLFDEKGNFIRADR